MAYTLTADQVPAQSVPVLASIMLNDTHRALDQVDDRDEQIHFIRKQLKKLRALLKLIRKDIDSEIYNRDNQRLRQLGQTLALQREAFVRTKILGKFRQLFPSHLSDVLEELERQSLYSGEPAGAAPKEELVSNIESELMQMIRSIQDWQPQSDGFSAYRSSLRKAYKQALTAHRKLCNEESGKEFHELRKKSKYLRYQFQLLRNFNPNYFKGFEKQLHQLTDALGEEHDLFELKCWLGDENITSRFEPDSAQLVACVIAQKRSQFQEQALALCPGIFFDKPASFIERAECASLYDLAT